jgi:hypothetical protein
MCVCMFRLVQAKFRDRGAVDRQRQPDQRTSAQHVWHHIVLQIGFGHRHKDCKDCSFTSALAHTLDATILETFDME